MKLICCVLILSLFPCVSSLSALRALINPTNSRQRNEFTGLLQFLDIWKDADSHTLLKAARQHTFQSQDDISTFEEKIRNNIPGIKAKVERFDRWQRDVRRRYRALSPEGRAYVDRAKASVDALLTDTLLKFNYAVADFFLLDQTTQDDLKEHFPASTGMMQDLLQTMQEAIGFINASPTQADESG